MTNETQTLMLGEVDIGQYVEIPDITDKRLENVKAKVSELEKECLEFEIEIYNKLVSEMISQKYPKIDLAFLKKSYIKNVVIREKPVSFQVPAFSVYPFYGTNNFSVERLFVYANMLYKMKFNDSKKILPQIVESYLIKSLGFELSTNEIGSEGEYILNKSFEHSFRIASQFNGLIPKRIKENVKESQKYFKKENIYLISETKPEEWNVTSILKADPLIIGLIGDKYAHLIAHFNTTPLENLVKDIYPKEKLN